MRAIILAAGKSTRTHPLTISSPKPLLEIGGKSILERNMDALTGIVDEVVIVVGFEKEQIIKAMTGFPFLVSFVEQKEQDGTGSALLRAADYISEPTIVIMGDNIYSKGSLKALSMENLAIMANHHEHPELFGVIKQENKILRGIDEKPKNAESSLINSGAYVIDYRVIDKLKNLKESKRKEKELTDALVEISKENDVAVIEVNSEDVIHISYPWDLLSANEKIISKIKEDIRGEVENNVTIKGPVRIGEGTIIKSGSYIEGPVIIGDDCRIGPNCYIREGTSIGKNCKIGNGCEVKNSIFMDNVSCGHLSYIGDSIIGRNTNLGAGTITANLRHDNSNVLSEIKGMLIDTGRRKLGAIIGNRSHTGIHTSIYPGRKIWPNMTTKPGDIIKKDIVR